MCQCVQSTRSYFVLCKRCIRLKNVSDRRCSLVTKCRVSIARDGSVMAKKMKPGLADNPFSAQEHNGEGDEKPWIIMRSGYNIPTEVKNMEMGIMGERSAKGFPKW